jgi:hypothetical protein
VHHATAESRHASGDDPSAWLRASHGPPAVGDVAIAELHALRLRGAHHQLG